MCKSAAVLSLLLVGLGHGGCSQLRRESPKSYTTVVTDSNRDPEKAREACERAGKLFDKGHLVKAEAALQEALIADVSYAPAHNNLGRIFFEQGKLYLAAWEFEYARRLLPDSAEVTNNLGMVYEAAGQTERAIEFYKMALSQDPRNPACIGNLARILVREQRDPQQVAALLQDLVFLDTRPDWVRWARDQLNLHGPVRAAAHAVVLPATRDPGPRDEVLPTPPPFHIDDSPPPRMPPLEIPPPPAEDAMPDY